LTPSVLAKIFQRDITAWDDSEITALNPDLNAPAGQNIVVAHRTKGSSSTYLASGYLDRSSGGVWTLGQNALITWPADTVAVQGSSGMAAELQQVDFSIGYIDSDHGHRLHLKEVALKNADGNWLTSLTADIAGAASGVTLPASDGDWSGVDLLNKAGANTWPIVTFSYMLVRQDLSAKGETGQLLKTYLEYVMDLAAQAEVSEFGFSPVPQNVLDINTAGIASLVLDNAATQFSFELSTDPVTGADRDVFSAKRRQYSDWQIEHTADELAISQNTVAELKAQIVQLQAKVTPLEEQVTGIVKAEDDDDDDISWAAWMGLILGAIAFVLSLWAVVKLNSIASSGVSYGVSAQSARNNGAYQPSSKVPDDESVQLSEIDIAKHPEP